MTKPARPSTERPDAAAPVCGSAADELAALTQIVRGTARTTGEAFLESLVRHLAAAIDVSHVFIAKFSESPSRVRTIAYWAHDHIEKPIEWDLAGTPCEEVVSGKLCHHPSGVWRLFPQDTPLVEMRIESYLGVPLIDDRGETMGHLAVFDQRPMPQEPRQLSIFQIFAQRASAELERMRMEHKLRESEKLFRDLFDEAPIGYVYEDTSTRFISANRAAQRMLGLKAEEVVGTVGLSLVAPTPEAQQRVHDSLAAEQSGHEKGVIELELRRKDNGKPVWVQRWSRPEQDGKHTRTVIVDITDRVLAEREGARLQLHNSYLREEIKSVHNFDEIVGRSPALGQVLRNVELVAATDATVLITGESGVGKELVARAIHSRSSRASCALIKVNCAALPTGLVESELFGHEKGAFTGAVSKRIGRFELAEGGTLFLDEIGELPLDVQVKLLRVLQEREYERVGGAKTLCADVRVIAATNRDLGAAVASGAFRQDLYYRLNVFPVKVPPLRERRADIPLLVHYYVSRSAARIGRPIERIPTEAMDRLCAYDWPGNVRELQNLIERAVILSPGSELASSAIVLPGQASAGHQDLSMSPPEAGMGQSLERIERDHILGTLRSTGWVVDGPRGAAQILGLHPNTLRSRMKKLDIRRSTDADS